MENEPEGLSGEPDVERTNEPLEHTAANYPWGIGGPPAVMALYSRFKRPYQFDIPSRRTWILLAIGFVALTAYLVATRAPLGQLAITTVPDATCRVDVSGYCASNPIPWADVRISEGGPEMVVTSGADGRVVVGLMPGEYSVGGSEVGDLHGTGSVTAVVSAGQTVEVQVTFTR
jgi:hypothetical protein